MAAGAFSPAHLPYLSYFYSLAAGPHPRGELTPMLALRSACLRARMAAGAEPQPL